MSIFLLPRCSPALPLPAFGALPPFSGRFYPLVEQKWGRNRGITAAAALTRPGASADGGEDGAPHHTNHDLRSNRPDTGNVF